MGERYKMEDLGLESLVGLKILVAEINEEKDLVVLHTTQGKRFLTWEGDCCAKCYLAHVSGSDTLINGATILEVNTAEWVTESKNEDDYEVIESMGTNIKTDKGHMSFESRVEHNGFYGGEILVSDDEPMDQYRSPKYEGKELPNLSLLHDF